MTDRQALRAIAQQYRRVSGYDFTTQEVVIVGILVSIGYLKLIKDSSNPLNDYYELTEKSF